MLLLLPVGVYAISKFYNTHIQSVILIGVAIFLIITYAGQKWYHNLMLFAIGWFLSSIGFSKELMQYNYEWLIDYKKFYYLHFGLPLYPVVVALFVFPIFLKEWNSPRPGSSALDKLWDNKFVQHLREFWNNIGSSIRGTVIGSLCGLVPHMTSTLASNVAYIREMNRQKKKGTYDENGDIKSLVSAETANNAAGLTQLTPLLLIGIPITTSEAIVLNIIENNMQVINWETTVATGMFWPTGVVLHSDECFVSISGLAICQAPTRAVQDQSETAVHIHFHITDVSCVLHGNHCATADVLHDGYRGPVANRIPIKKMGHTDSDLCICATGTDTGCVDKIVPHIL